MVRVCFMEIQRNAAQMYFVVASKKQNKTTTIIILYTYYNARASEKMSIISMPTNSLF